MRLLYRTGVGMTNADIAELLALEGEKAAGQLRMAFKRAARRAFLWPDEASDLAAKGHPLTNLSGVGPFIERKIIAWLNDPPKEHRSSELRSNFLTLAEARRVLARRSDWMAAYKGDLQMHTDWSDGSATISEMAEAAIARCYEYIAITDHSKGLKIAGGITEAQLKEQQVEIAGVNRSLIEAGKRFRVLSSVELNLNTQGQGDMELSALRNLDLVVGAFHSALRQTADQTDRYVAALSNRSVNVLGHPKGRIYNYRRGLTADWKRVFATAARLDKAVEVDSYPDRQDLDVGLLQLAKREGVRIAIDTDAHAPEQLAFVELGLASALQAGIAAEKIINFMPADSLIEWARANRS